MAQLAAVTLARSHVARVEGLFSSAKQMRKVRSFGSSPKGDLLTCVGGGCGAGSADSYGMAASLDTSLSKDLSFHSASSWQATSTVAAPSRCSASRLSRACRLRSIGQNCSRWGNAFAAAGSWG